MNDMSDRIEDGRVECLFSVGVQVIPDGTVMTATMMMITSSSTIQQTMS